MARLHANNPEIKLKKIEYDKIYRVINRNKINTHAKEYYQKPINKDKRRKRNLIKRYGLTDEQYNTFLNTKTCCLCGKELVVSNVGCNKIVIDHNHTTGVVRGFICSACNLIIGLCNEDVNVLSNIINYLQ